MTIYVSRVGNSGGVVCGCAPCELGPTVRFVLSGFNLCLCVDGRIAIISIDPNGEWNAGYSAGQWLNFDVGTGVIRTYDNEDCTGDFEVGPEIHCAVIIDCEDNELTVEIIFGTETVFLGTGAIGEPINNTIVCGAANVHFAGGTITVFRI